MPFFSVVEIFFQFWIKTFTISFKFVQPNTVVDTRYLPLDFPKRNVDCLSQLPDFMMSMAEAHHVRSCLSMDQRCSLKNRICRLKQPRVFCTVILHFLCNFEKIRQLFPIRQG